MSQSEPVGCSKPVAAPAPEAAREAAAPIPEQGVKTMIKVGQKAPDFTTSAYQDGGFKTITLSDYLGKWVVLCFYPGDFTFV